MKQLKQRKHPKQMTAIIVGLLILILPLNGYAKDNLNVWIDEEDLKTESNEMVVEIQTDGTSTDGLLVITYDSERLQLAESNVTLANTIEMSSIHIEKDGTLKIAYLAENPIEKGTLATIDFKVTKDTSSENTLLFEGDVHDADGNSLHIGILETEDVPETNPPEDETPKDETPDENLPNHENPKDDAEKPSSSSSESISTGDDTNILPYAISAGLALAIVGTILLKKRKRKE